MKKNILSGNNKEFILPGVLFILIIIITIFVLIPKIKEIFAIKSEITAQKNEIQQLSAKLSDLQTLSEAELFDSSNLLLNALPSQKDFYLVLSSIRKVFLDNSSNLESFDFSPGLISTEGASNNEAANQNSGTIRIKLDFSASPDNLVNLILSLEKTLPLIEVTSIKFDSISSASSSGSVQDWKGQMGISSFSLPLPKVLGSLNSPLPKITSQDKKVIEELKLFSRFIPEVQVVTEETPNILGKDNPFPF